jgi:hypothetical protein
MAALKFRMVNDQTGEEIESTLDDEMDNRAKGFSVVPGGVYAAALRERADELAPPEPPAKPTIADLQTRSDAVLSAERTFPDADGGDDKPTKKERVEATDADDPAVRGPVTNAVEGASTTAAADRATRAAATTGQRAPARRS